MSLSTEHRVWYRWEMPSLLPRGKMKPHQMYVQERDTGTTALKQWDQGAWLHTNPINLQVAQFAFVFGLHGEM